MRVLQAAKNIRRCGCEVKRIHWDCAVKGLHRADANLRAMRLAPHVSHARGNIDPRRLRWWNDVRGCCLWPVLSLKPVEDHVWDEPGERREYVSIAQAVLLRAVEADRMD